MEELNHGGDFPLAGLLDGSPLFGGQWVDADSELVELGALHHGGDFAGCNTEVEDGAVAHVGAPSGEAAFVVAKGLEMSAPTAPPKTGGNFHPALEFADGLECVALFFERFGLFSGLLFTLGDGDVGFVKAPAHDDVDWLKSRRMKLSSSSLFIAVNSFSVPPRVKI